MSIQRKLWSGFGLLIALFACLGLYQKYQLNVLGQQALRAFDQPLTAVDRSWAAWDTFTRSRQLVDDRLTRIHFENAQRDGEALQTMQQEFAEQLMLAAEATQEMMLDVDADALGDKASEWYRLNLQRIGAGTQRNLPDERVLLKLETELHEGLQGLVKTSLDAAAMQKSYTAEEVDQTILFTLIVMVVVIVLGIGIAVGLARSLTKPLDELLKAICELSHGDGDLTRRLAMQRKDELGQLGDQVDLFISKIHGIVRETQEALSTASSTLSDVGQMTQNTKQGVEDQKGRLYETAVEVEQMTAAVESVSARTHSANDQAQLINQEAQQSLVLVNESGKGIQELAVEVASASEEIQALSDASESISELLVVIEAIADQTNLLALNAAIEAARAGEAGRGFAVVADEVRSLAMKTRESTENIQQTVGGIQSRVQSAREVMDQGRELAERCVAQSEVVSQALNSMSGNVSAIEAMNNDIANEIEQQRTSMMEINKNVENINEVADQTSETTTQLQDGRYALENALSQVEGRMSQFRL